MTSNPGVSDVAGPITLLRSVVLALLGSMLVAPHSASALAAETAGVDHELLRALPQAKLSLEQGIDQAVALQGGAAISAKFELGDDGKLSLSVYVAQKGLETDAEHNVLEELAASPATVPWQPGVEVFKDAEHIARSAQQLTLAALSKKSLSQVIAEARRRQQGTVFSITPEVHARKPVYEVLMLEANGEVAALDFDALSGRLLSRRELE